VGELKTKEEKLKIKEEALEMKERQLNAEEQRLQERERVSRNTVLLQTEDEPCAKRQKSD
jgi:hypothetical protein